MIKTSIVEMTDIETGKTRSGFIDYDSLQSKYIFIFFNDDTNSWNSSLLTNFRPTKSKVNLLNEEMSTSQL